LDKFGRAGHFHVTNIKTDRAMHDTCYNRPHRMHCMHVMRSKHIKTTDYHVSNFWLVSQKGTVIRETV